MENNHNNNNMKRIALIGGGPCSLFMYKRLVQSRHCHLSITIFEAKDHLGQGMPYSADGANDEHVTNVSGNEIPDLVSSLSDWVNGSAPQSLLDRLHVNKACFHEYKVVPRLLFGSYLEAQYQLLIEQGDKQGLKTTVHLRTTVVDISYQKERVLVRTAKNIVSEFDYVVIATGHIWPKKHEGEVPGYFDSPYPPSKLQFTANHPVAVIGSSLTAIDAIRTLARHNGTFEEDNTSGLLTFKTSDESPEFRIIIHTRHGLLPVVRIHLADSHLTAESILSPEQIADNRAKNGGFLSLDYVFEKNFKELFITKDPKFYEKIRNMSMEEFVGAMMNFREHLEPFLLLKLEYAEAEKSIQRHESVIWKEMLAILSFAMNYPAKYFSAEDMLRLQKELMPLIAIVIAFIPQSSCRELMALHNAGKLDIIGVGFDSAVHVDEDKRILYKYGKDAQHKEVEFKTYVDATGQKHMAYEDFPFKSLMQEEVISTAKILFHDNEAGKQARENGNKNVHENENGKYYLLVPGITINDYYQLVDESGASNEQIYNMAVPHMGGYNPDYSGLDFCEAASQVIVDRIFEDKKGMTKDGLAVAH